MLSNCVFTYVFLWSTYNNRNCNNVFSGLVKKLTPPIAGTIVNKPIPLVNGELAPVSWYYSLFTEKELGDALEKHNSPFPTKTFLVFEEMEPIKLDASGKELVKFQVVDKNNVDRIIKDNFEQTIKGHTSFNKGSSQETEFKAR